MLKDPIAHVALPHEPSYTKEYAFDFDDAVAMVRSGQPPEQAARALLAIMTRQEQLWLLDGDEPFWRGLRGILFDRYNRKPFVMGALPNLRVPGIRFTDGPRGIVMHSSTCFPVSMSRGATWDVELEQRIGEAIGLEGRAQGANYFAGICINLPRHPAWGRIQETYSEDSLLLGGFGVALHNGLRPHLMTCVKHFALNSMENARFSVDVQIDDAALHEVYLPHFRQLVEAGATSIMASYNSLRGEFAGQNRELLNDILRGEWGFRGPVISDFIFGLRDPVKSLENGLDVEAPFRQQRADNGELSRALDRGDLSWKAIDQSCVRTLSGQIEHMARTGHGLPEPSFVFCDDHRNLARQAASQGMVLLKNDVVSGHRLLPLHASQIRRLAIVGRLANRANTGDRGSSAVFAPNVVTFYEGLRAALPSVEIMLSDDDSVEEAQRLATGADAVVCIVGYDAGDEGEYVVPDFKEQQELLDLLPPCLNDEDAEVRAVISGQQRPGFGSGATNSEALVAGAGGDRRSLRLRDRDVDIIKAISSVSSRMIVGVVAAGAVIMEEWLPSVPAALMTFYPGCEGGHALADVLLGKVDASGRMPFSVPRDEAHLPFFDIAASSIVYDKWHGQRLLDKLGVTARFPLGYGLSYTTFALQELTIDTRIFEWDLERFTASVKLANTGFRHGRHVVQIYGTLNAPDFPSRVLLGFRSIAVDPGQSILVEVSCSLRPLKRRIGTGFLFASRTIGLEAASFAGDDACLRANLLLPPEIEVGSSL